MDEIDKLRILIPHWIEHNEEHAQEFQKWSAVAAEAEEDIANAADAMRRANVFLKSALEKLGGAIS